MQLKLEHTVEKFWELEVEDFLFMIRNELHKKLEKKIT